ncbi:MAG: histidinol dehydrogenase [Desulfurococcales archaeon]|nr:histidinol dehydrogenase [Desulfurococcales archaeon]
MKLVRLTTRAGLGKVLGAIGRRWSLGDYIERVRPIVAEVEARGYPAVMDYSLKLDGVAYEDPLVSRDEVHLYEEPLDYGLLEAIERVVDRVKSYHRATMPSTSGVKGARLTWRPVDRVAIYVPGGRNPYPSTAIMTVAPASVAGVRGIHVLTPPRRGRLKADPAVVVAAFKSGASGVYAVGGPHAVAGVAYGTIPLPRVDLVVGPGGPYVQAAKALVHGVVGIDMIAGPTELFIIASGVEPGRVALEALAQAEHGPSSTVVIASPDQDLLDRVEASLAGMGYGGWMAPIFLVETSSIEEAADLASLYAPEHLQILAPEPDRIAGMVRSAGAVSLGVPTAYLDYAAGPSHVLPTSGAARWRGGLSVYDFLKPVSMVDAVDEDLVSAARVLAEYEGFKMHLRSLGGR